MKKTLAALALTAVLALAGCSYDLIRADQQPSPAVATDPPASTASEEPPASQKPAKPAAWRPSVDVDWENYSPKVKTRIDRLGEDAYCDSLQKQFDTADQNNTAQRNRTGDGNADLMAYIDEWMSHADCY